MKIVIRKLDGLAFVIVIWLFSYSVYSGVSKNAMLILDLK